MKSPYMYIEDFFKLEYIKVLVPSVLGLKTAIQANAAG